jgi:hypothetical protein
MANRLILVPEELYNGLLNTTARKSAAPLCKNKNDSDIAEEIMNRDETGLNLSKKNMDTVKRKIPNKIREKLKKKKTLDTTLSTRKLMYDQEFRRYLKHRREFKNRPVKIEIVPKGPKILLKNNNTAARAGIIDDDGDFEGLDGSFINNGYHHHYNKSEDGLETSNGESVREEEDTFLTPSPRHNHTPRRLRSNPLRAAIDQAKREFKEYVLRDPETFNIRREDNAIFYPSSGRVIKNANLDAIIDRLVNPNMENKPSPAGTQQVGRAAYRDETLRALMLTRFTRHRGDEEVPENLDAFLAAKGSVLRRPRGQQAHQSGSGGVGFIKRDKGGDYHNFRPLLWNQAKRRLKFPRY